MSLNGPIVVTGATGTIGGHLARQLLAAGVPVRAPVRNAERAAELAGAGAEVVTADFAGDGLGEAFAGAAGAFLMVPVHDDMVAMGTTLHRAAAQAGVERVVHLSVFTPILEYDAFLGRSHRALDEDFRRHFPDGGAILRPEGFMENLMAMAGSIRQGQLFNVGTGTRTAFIAASDVAACAAALLTGRAPCEGIHDLTGPAALGWAEVAETLAEVLGREVTFVDIPLEAYMGEVRKAGLPPVLVDVIESLARYRLERPAPEPTGEVERLNGQAPTSLAAWIRDHRPVFSPAG